MLREQKTGTKTFDGFLDLHGNRTASPLSARSFRASAAKSCCINSSAPTLSGPELDTRRGSHQLQQTVIFQVGCRRRNRYQERAFGPLPKVPPVGPYSKPLSHQISWRRVTSP